MFSGVLGPGTLYLSPGGPWHPESSPRFPFWWILGPKLATPMFLDMIIMMFLSGKSSSGLLRGAKMGIWGKIWVFGSKYGYLGQVRLVSQIWPSGQELGSQPQAPGSIPLAPLDPTSVLVGGAPSGGYFSPKSPF